MITTEELDKKIKLFSQEAWRSEVNTTVNSMIEYVVKKTSDLLLDEVNEEIQELHYQLNKLKPPSEVVVKENEYGKDGRHENAKWGTKAQDQVPHISAPRRGRPANATSNGT